MGEVEGGGEEEGVAEEGVDQDASTVTMATPNRNCLHHMHSKLYFLFCFLFFLFHIALTHEYS